MGSKILLKISKFLVYLLPFSVVIVYQRTLFPFIVGKYTFFRSITLLAFVFFVWAWAIGEFEMTEKSAGVYRESGRPRPGHGAAPAPSRRLFYNPLAVAIALFTAIFLLSGFLGYNPTASFWSNFERGEGGLQLFCLFLFFILLIFLFRDEASWRRLFSVSIWAGLAVITYGLAGAAHIDNFIGSNLCSRFSGSLGNPAYLGTLMIFAVFYSLYLFVGASKPRKKWKFLVLAVLFFTFLLLSQTRGALLGLGVAIFAGLVFLFFSLEPGQTRKTILVLLIAMAVLSPLAFIFRRNIDLLPFCPAETGGNRILDVSLEGETYQTRLLLWGQSIKAFGERPILGWGPENFSIAFEKYFDIHHTAWFDRAHNIFFDYLVFSGILGLVSFIGIFVSFYIQFFKFRKKLVRAVEERRRGRDDRPEGGRAGLYQSALLFSLVIAYLIQGLVLFDVLPIYINIFLFLAFANWKLNL